jgi:hypothetical protein
LKVRKRETGSAIGEEAVQLAAIEEISEIQGGHSKCKASSASSVNDSLALLVDDLNEILD